MSYTCVVSRKCYSLLFILVFICTGLVYGQDDYSQREYIHFNLGAGSHKLLYNTLNGGRSDEFNFSVNVCYSYFFQPHWGLQAGIGLQSFESKSSLNDLSGFSDVDADGDAYDFQIKYNKRNERQNLLFATIPLELQYMTYLNERYGLIVSAGLKYAIPVVHKYRVENGAFVTSGYYERWNLELYDLPQHGFASFEQQYKGNLAVRPVLFGTVSLGGLITVSNLLDLYVGTYLDYGLNNLLKSGAKHWNGVETEMWTSSGISSVKPVALGMKIGFYFNFLSVIDWMKYEKWK